VRRKKGRLSLEKTVVDGAMCDDTRQRCLKQSVRGKGASVAVPDGGFFIRGAGTRRGLPASARGGAGAVRGENPDGFLGLR